MYHQGSAIRVVSTVLNNFKNTVFDIVFSVSNFVFCFRNPLRSPVLYSAIEVCCLLSATVWSWCLLLGNRVGVSSWISSRLGRVVSGGRYLWIYLLGFLLAPNSRLQCVRLWLRIPYSALLGSYYQQLEIGC